MSAAENIVELPRPGLQPEDPSALRSQLCTDANSAKMFSEEFGPYVRHVPSWGWLRWSGTAWTRDETGEVRRMCECLGDRFRAMVSQYRDAATARYIFSWARNCESAKGTRDILTMAENRVSAPVEQFDAHPYLVNTRNCTLDFERIEGELPHHREHARADYLTRTIPVDWHMCAPCPGWHKFLSEIFPCEAVRAFVQRLCGYSILGTTREQVFVIGHGGGCNGKSVFLGTLRAVLGDGYAASLPAESFMLQRGDTIRNDLAGLAGVRFLTSSESSEGRRLNEGLIKMLCGGEKVCARFLFKEFFEFLPQFTWWLCTNHRPTITDSTLAMWRRVILVPFETTIAPDRQDRRLPEKLQREAEGILDWAVQGAVDYVRNGLNPPSEVVAATQEYRVESDTIGQFLADACTRDSKHSMISKRDLYAQFVTWCEAQGETPLTQCKFSKSLAERGFDSVRGSGGVRFWLGLEVTGDRL